MRDKKIDIIACPSCGREYLPAEIFIPKYFIGTPSDIIKTQDGRIDTFTGMSMDTKETYICDGCQKPFKVTARVQFKAEYDSSHDFTTGYVSNLRERKIHLFEG